MDQSLETLIKDLNCNDGVQRKNAREAIVKTGKPAVPYLVKILSDSNDRVRWEACKALGSIKDPVAAIPLTKALGDKVSEVRWLAAEALITIDSAAIVPVLEALISQIDSHDLRQGAHHVLNALAKKDLLDKATIDVLDKLSNTEPNSSVYLATQTALNAIKKTKK
ncbi:MAG: HEAT repeat domain-containing protein [Calditrichaeota bacterium]|nr:HEAT repeat domain-containing protein [Calditrichota bacterium]MCB0269454.1 HEAT repeat domain-containing protein [Calditrichota bacterium]MCB0286067.1 HEAT repeat domain-containing protein [Calditrichota bacterium]MCB9069267.1 HEAT repeat domain-containing protein [Calditrichia bacterium]